MESLVNQVILSISLTGDELVLVFDADTVLVPSQLLAWGLSRVCLCFPGFFFL